HLNETGSQMSEQDVALGCPLDHFSQEMAPLDSEFQKRLDHLYQKKHTALVDALRRGQTSGNVTRDVSAESIALMINATLQGCMAIAKYSRSLETLMQCGAGLIHYLEQLRPPN
ncbi:MAG: TetR family transcriptional regulator C-terminal domain-containing protein, partial [Gammaproteobacteria bacterium]